MISVNEFLQTLRTAHDVPNYYCNKYPKNLGYFDGSKYSFDCWNLIKVVLSGWKPNPTPGYFVHSDKLVTGDVDGSTILKNCTGQSKDFSKLSVPGTYLYLATNPHAGVFVGEFTQNGKVYNVIECTKGMYAGQDGVTYSYVDKDGTRRAWKGGNAKLRWTDYGLLTKWVSYNDIPAPQPTPTPARDWLQKGDEGPEVAKTQQALLDKSYDPKGIDGIFGNNTEKAVKAFQKANGLVVDGCVGPKTKDILFKPVEESKDEAVYYTVKSGDTLTSIAAKNNTTIENLIKLNPQIKNPDKIYKGDKVRIS